MGLDGLRVLDLAGMPAIYGAKLLSDLGADVVRVEPPGGDPLRDRGPWFRGSPGPGRSLSFAFYNTNKRSIVLDTSHETGQNLLSLLAMRSSIVIDSADPDTTVLPGIGVESLDTVMPGIIWVKVTPFGLNGPRRGWKANDLVAMAAGGVLGLNGFPGSRPIQAPLDQAYHLGGIAAASGALIALRRGGGQIVDVSLQAAVATATENTLGYWDLEQFNRPRLGDRAFNGTAILYRCRDGWVAGMAGNRWEDLIHWAEEAGVATAEWYDPALIDRSTRADRMDTANRLVASLFATQPVAEVARRAEQIRIPIQPVNRIDDLFRDRQLSQRGFWTALPHDDLGATITYPGAPFQSSSGFWRLRRRAPLPGEHTREILGELGYGDDEIRDLEREGIVQSWHEQATSPRRRSYPAARLTNADPLAGIRVLDFSQAVTGPLVGRLLGDHGAEVIKIEWGNKPDPQRFFPPRNGDGPNVSALFNLVNASKKSLTLNLNLPSGRQLLRRLVAVSDIILDNYGTDPFPKWGLTYDEARAIQPGIVMARSSTAGRSGPRAGLAGLGYGISAAAGWNRVMGFPGEPPVGMGPAYPDYSVNCHHLLVAILVALDHRRQTGEGQYIDLSQHESTIGWIGPAILDYTANGHISEPKSNHHPDYAPHGVYPALGVDRWIAIAVAPDDWVSFTAVAAQDSVRSDGRFASHATRKANEDALDAMTARWTAQHDSKALAERLQAAGIAASNVANGEDLVTDPQLADHFVRLDHPDAGQRLWDRAAFRIDGFDATPTRSPLLSEHNDWALEDLLGLTTDEIADLYVAGVIG